jgi:diphthamide synthase (EF-2-diphthine--ammonia ligase)
MKFAVSWLGRELDMQCLKDLKVLSDKFGIDVCGEKGEYHT